MILDASPGIPIFTVPHGHLADIATEIAKRKQRTDSMRSAENIRLWNEYLPEDCVNTMIKLRWDRTV